MLLSWFPCKIRIKDSGFYDVSWNQEECNIINLGEEDEMEIYGYEKSRLSTVLMWIGIILTFGLFGLVLHWKPVWRLYLTHKRSRLKCADEVLVVDTYEKGFKSLFIKKVKFLNIGSYRISKHDLHENQINRLTVRIHLNNGTSKEVSNVRALHIKKMSYIWDDDKQSFVKLVGIDRGLTRSTLHNFKGFSKKEQKLRGILYGKNEINIKVEKIRTLIVLEMLNPFYVFQAFAIYIWIAQEYYFFCSALILLSVYGISYSVIQTHQNQKSLNEKAYSTGTVTVCRGDDNYEEEVSTSDLVPGDLIVIPKRDYFMPCDAVLLKGTCIVNESMITGESEPVVKTAVQNENSLYNDSEDSNHTLFCGTQVLQTHSSGKGRVHAVVSRTGFLTAKGKMIQSILYPPPADYQFDRQTYKFIWILGVVGCFGFFYAVLILSGHGVSRWDIVLKALAIFTITIPPTLPGAMAVGKVYALKRLKEQKISCINSRVVNVSGSVNCICFDKTGTLTEDSLDIYGVIPVTGTTFAQQVNNISQLGNGPLLFGMATCHSLGVIDDVIFGDPLDIKMFESTGWILEVCDEPDESDETNPDIIASAIVRPSTTDCELKISLVYQFQFCSALQKMSVVTKVTGLDNFVLFTKGSPEMIQSLSDPSTVPQNIISVLQNYTQLGYRVIALGYRELIGVNNYKDLQNIHRSQIERDLNFCGFIILENCLKPQTAGVIDELNQAQIRVVMITGDNLLTALSVANECGIIKQEENIFEVYAETCENSKPIISYISKTSHPIREVSGMRHGISEDTKENTIGLSNSPKFAVTGTSLSIIRDHCPELMRTLCSKGVVFARMSPNQKQQLIQDIQKLGYCVAMCGDGANDCGALKTAHSGISLSEAESSVASPFSSQVKDITCVPVVLRECRAALVTSLGMFKFLVLYSFGEFASVLVLYSIQADLNVNQYLFIDVLLVLNFVCSFGRTKAHRGPLVPEVPITNIFSPTCLVSMTFQVIMVIIFQYLSFYLIQQFPWYEPFHYDNPLYFFCYENYAVFAMSLSQYITFAVIYSQGAPFRQPIYTNKIFFSSIIIATFVSIYVIVSRADWVIYVFTMKVPETFDFIIFIIGLSILYFCISLFFENFVLQYILFKR